MFLEKNGFAGRKNRIIVGYDLGDDTSQISFCRMNADEIETISIVAGEEQYDFPTALCRLPETNQWAYGKEAVRLSEEGKGSLVTGLLTLAREGGGIQIGEESFDPTALLALFLKRSLSLLSMEAMAEQIEAMMITVEGLDHRTIEVLTQAAAVMQLGETAVYFQGYAESVYQYAVHQPPELWKGHVLVCDYEEDRLHTYCLECNRRTTPIVAFVEEARYPRLQKSDEALLPVLEKYCGKGIVSSAYLIGKGFEGEWYQECLRYLCRGRRVFRGNNLYSKGACYAAKEKVMPDEMSGKYVFLGNDKLKANMGMRVLRKGQESYYALLDAGTNWYEAEKQCEFYLESGNSFSILVTSMTGKESKEVEIILNDLPGRGPGASKIRMSVSMKSAAEAEIVLEDLGFGTIYPASGKTWRENFQI